MFTSTNRAYAGKSVENGNFPDEGAFFKGHVIYFIER